MATKRVNETKNEVSEPATIEVLSPKTLTSLIDLPAKASKLVRITTDVQLTEADQIDKMCAELIKGITAELADGKKKAYDAWKWFTAYEGEKTAPLLAARKHLSKLVAECLSDRERVAEEKARTERVEAAKQAREAAEADRLAQLEVLEQEGNLEAAAELMGEDLVVENIQAVKAEVTRPAGLGMHTVSRWRGEVTDLKKLLQAVLDGKVALGTAENPGIVMVNQKYLDKLAGLDKSTLNIPGVKAVEDKGTSR